MNIHQHFPADTASINVPERGDNDRAAIPTRFLALEKEIEVTVNLARSLHDRLAPVLGPQVPADTEKASGDPEVAESPLASNIRDLTYRVRSVQDVLRDALDRLEVSQ